MTNYYSNSVDYNNDLDNFEARIRAEEAERELNKKPVNKIVLDAVAIYDEAFERTHDFKLAAEAVEAAMGDDSTAWDAEKNDLRTIGLGG